MWPWPSGEGGEDVLGRRFRGKAAEGKVCYTVDNEVQPSGPGRTTWSSSTSAARGPEAAATAEGVSGKQPPGLLLLGQSLLPSSSSLPSSPTLPEGLLTPALTTGCPSQVVQWPGGSNLEPASGTSHLPTSPSHPFWDTQHSHF